MNFLDAHRIVHGYIDAIANNENKDALMYYSKAFLPFEYDKEMIINAFKIFFAHMILYGTRTPEQFDQYKIMANFINNFIDDDVYKEIIYFKKISDGRKPNNKGKLELYNNAVNIKHRYMRDIGERMSNTYKEDLFFNFMTSMKEKRKTVAENIHTDEYDKFLKDYMQECYNLIGFEAPAIEFFYPFNLMRESLKDEKYIRIYEGYVDYILTHQ